ncbi:MAG TPA: alpha/beta hydrolase, partial [Acidimicrobiales bacterium]|nr:alpha/beta hydrolase [Acidimicrobiales bacterium]
METPATAYALRGGVHVGYQVWGGGPDAVDVLEFNSGLMISIDETLDEPHWLGYTRRIAEFSRLVRFDRGGLGLSDPLPHGMTPSIEGWGRDAMAVMDAAGCSSAVVLASMGGAMAALWLAATHPERVRSLVLVNGTARVGQAEDYGFGVREELTGTAASIDVPLVDGGVPQDVAILAPSLARRVGFEEWWGRASRRGASPATAIAFNLVTFSADVRWCLPLVSCPTLVLSRAGTYAGLDAHGRYLAEHVGGARFVTFAGRDLLPWAGDFEAIVEEIEEFVTGTRGTHAATRTLATVLFTDI